MNLSKLWEIVEDRGAWLATVRDVTKSWTQLSDQTTTICHVYSRWCLESHSPHYINISVLFQFSSVTQSCPTLCDPVDSSTPGFPVYHQLPELTQTHVHRVGDAIQPSHPLPRSSTFVFSLSQHQDLFQWVDSSHQVVKGFYLQI